MVEDVPVDPELGLLPNPTPQKIASYFILNNIFNKHTLYTNLVDVGDTYNHKTTFILQEKMYA